MIDFTAEFKDFLINEKKSSSNTIESYMRDVGKFLSYCELNHIKKITAVKDDTIVKYEQFALFNGQSEATVLRTFASLRCYFGFLSRKNYIASQPKVSSGTKKVTKKLPEILTNKEVLLLLAQPDTSDYKGLRDKAMLETLYATGIKVSELIDLKISDVNLQIGILHTHSAKGERIIPIYPDAVKTLRNYLINVRTIVAQDSDNDCLFTNMNGQPMTRQGFWKIIKQYAASAKINKDITPHTLRHSFAAHLLENGAQLTDIKEMLGHSDISSTQVYAQLMKNKYASSYSKFHPLAK